jgi:poly(A) polymerase
MAAFKNSGGEMEDRILIEKMNRCSRLIRISVGLIWTVLAVTVMIGCSTVARQRTKNINEKTCRADDIVRPGWERSFKAGTRDNAGNYMGGSTIVHLLGHKGKLYAGNSYWLDSRNMWYGGSDPGKGWAQVLRLDNPGGKWQVDLGLGPQHLRVEILKSVTFTTDGQGKPLPEPVNLLVASTYTPTPNSIDITVFTRNDDTGIWNRNTIYSGEKPADNEDRSVRAINMHRDSVTGVDRIFLSIGKLGVFSGVYDPQAPGKIRWDNTSESGPVETRVLAIIEANGSLLFSAGRMVYRRNDGASPSYTLVHDMSDLHAGVSRQLVGGIRGLTAIPNPNGEGDSLLFVMGEGIRSRGCVYRLDPDGGDKYARHREICIDTPMTDYLNGNPVYFILAAYNDIYPVADATSGEPLHIIGFESWIGGHQYPLWGANDKGGFYAGGMYAIRDKNGKYRVNEVNGPNTKCTPDLVAITVMALSPFKENKGKTLYLDIQSKSDRRITPLNHYPSNCPIAISFKPSGYRGKKTFY